MDINSGGAAKELQVATGPAFLLMIAGRNLSSSTVYLQLHNSASTPANGATAILSVKLLAGENFSISYPVSTYTTGRRFSVGLYVCASTTDTTKTLSGTNDLSFDVQVEAITR